MRSKYNKIISIMLVMLIVLGGISGLFVGGDKAFAADFAGGSGTESDPYQIATAGQLDTVRYYLQAGVYFKLTAEIDLAGYSNWQPIGLADGNIDNYFKGNMDGNGFKVKNLTINETFKDTVGLFGIAYYSVIHNMALENVNVTARSSVAGLVGNNYFGTISNSYTTGTVSGTNRVGGLVADNYGTIKNSYSTVNVTAATIEVGGLLGQNGDGGVISNSFATGTVLLTGTAYGTGRVGGLVGISGGQINNSYATGNVTGSSDVGGLVGVLNANFGPGTIKSSYSTGAVSATTTNYVGGLIGGYYNYRTNNVGDFANSYYNSTTSGKSDTGKGVGKTTTELQTQSTFVGWSFNSVWYILPNHYPELFKGNLAQGTTGGTTKLENIKGMGYLLEGSSYTEVTTNASIDNIEVDAGDTILIHLSDTPSVVKTLTVALTDIRPAIAPTAVLAPGTNLATTSLNAVTTDMEYRINDNAFNPITDTSVDNITINVNDRIYVRTKATALQPASYEQLINVAAGNIKTLVIDAAEIEGVAVPVIGGTPTATVTDTTEYTATIAWSPSAGIFAGNTAYTATITIIPKAGYTLTGVAANFFKVAGAVATNSVDNGVITAVFPKTDAVIATATIAGVTKPVTGAAPVTTIADTVEYTATIEWSPSEGVFAGNTAHIATITITPTAGHTLAGVVENYFKVAGATTTNAANSGVVTAVFPATNAIITTAAIAGVTRPVTGETPVAAISDTTEYTATIAWSPLEVAFAGNTAYTATITLTPKAGHTLTGVGENYFTVAGAVATNSLNTGIITAVFPKTDAVISETAIDGVTRPVTGGTPVATIVDTTAYTATIAWSPVNAIFAATTAYTATITITPTAGHTLATVGENYYTVAGASATNSANSGVVTAVFPATEAVIAEDVITGVTRPVTGETPVATVTDTTYYTATINWSPSAVTFAGNTDYTATISLTPKAGYTLVGVPEDFFTVEGAVSTNSANTGIITAVFPTTDAVIATAAIAGVTRPVIGETAVVEIADTTEYTATIAWSPSAVTFAGNTAYTATIAISPKAGYTLTEVTDNFFTVEGAIATNSANAGIVTAVFPATYALSTVATLTSTIGTVSTGGTEAESITSIPNATTLVAMKAAITPAAKATFEVYDADGTTVATALATGKKVVVTAENRIAKVTYTLTVIPAATPTPTETTITTPIVTPVAEIVSSTNGSLTLPVGKPGEVSLGDEMTVSIPANATNQELRLSISKILDPQSLLTDDEVLASPVYEILKNFSGDFINPVTLTFAFSPASLKSNQKAVVFYYDEVNKIWVEVPGGKVNGTNITVEVNHFTKFAVLAVDIVAEVPALNFSDIAGYWAEANIKQAVSSGIVKGYPNGTFKPTATVTRAEFAVMIMNALKSSSEGTALTFTDTTTIGAWAQKAVAQAVQAGIIKGYEDGTFRPNAEITRAEMAVILANASDQAIEASATTDFADNAAIPAWATSSVAYVKQAGIVQGKGNNQFAPQAYTTRAEAVTVLLNMLAQKSK
jgi:hypothetical protein